MSDVFTKHGIEFLGKKPIWPTVEGDYVGVHLDKSVCVARVQQERAERYTKAVDSVLAASD